MEFEKKTSKCPECGDRAVLTPWKPPKGINQRFREYKCSNPACRYVFYTCGIFHIDNNNHEKRNSVLTAQDQDLPTSEKP